jgi:hypothetical protein
MEVFVAGLVGALLSAALSFFVRAELTKRVQREAEKRVAYVHFVQVSYLVAVDVATRWYVKVLVDASGADSLKAIKTPDGEYEPSHTLSLLFAFFLRNIPRDVLQQLPGTFVITRMLRSLVDGLKSDKLKPEQLASLPRETIIDYWSFLSNLGHLTQFLSLWADYFEHDGRSWVTAKEIHSHWLCIERLFKSARRLRTALMKAGSISSEEASTVFETQVNQIKEFFSYDSDHKRKLEAATESIKNLRAEAVAEAVKSVKAP